MIFGQKPRLCWYFYRDLHVRILLAWSTDPDLIILTRNISLQDKRQSLPRNRQRVCAKRAVHMSNALTENYLPYYARPASHRSSPARSAGGSDGSTIDYSNLLEAEVLTLTYLIKYNGKVLTARITATFQAKRTDITNERSWKSPKLGADRD